MFFGLFSNNSFSALRRLRSSSIRRCSTWSFSFFNFEVFLCYRICVFLPAIFLLHYFFFRLSVSLCYRSLCYNVFLSAIMLYLSPVSNCLFLCVFFLFAICLFAIFFSDICNEYISCCYMSLSALCLKTLYLSLSLC